MTGSPFTSEIVPDTLTFWARSDRDANRHRNDSPKTNPNYDFIIELLG